MANPDSYIFPIIPIDPSKEPRAVVTYSEWNALMLSLVEQGNYTSGALQDVFSNIYTADEISSTELGDDGSRLIGVDTIPGVTGNNINEVIRNLKEQIDGITMGSVSDGSITSIKLAPNLDFNGDFVRFNGIDLLNKGDIITDLTTNDNNKVASSSTVYNLNINKQNIIYSGTAVPNESTPGNIYIQYPG